MIRGVGRGFIAGWAGLVMIIFALLVIALCMCCWCYGLLNKRRRDSLDDPVSDLTLQHDSPKFLKLLAQKERRLSQAHAQAMNSDDPKSPKVFVMYSGAVSPYQYPPPTAMTPFSFNGSSPIHEEKEKEKESDDEYKYRNPPRFVTTVPLPASPILPLRPKSPPELIKYNY